MAKKDFKNNPALAFISQESIDKVDGIEERQQAPAADHKASRKPESKSKRVQILMKPSLHSDAKALCEDMGISLNDFIHRAVQEAVYNDYVRGIIETDIEGKR